MKYISLLLFLLSTLTFAGNSPIIWNGACSSGAYNLASQACLNNGSVNSVSGTAPIVSSGGATPTISCNVASGSQAGCLASTDWTTFNNKQSALSFVAPLVNTAGSVAINGTVATNKLNFSDSSDVTKLFTFDLSGETTGKTLTYAPQNTSNMTLHIPQVNTAAGAASAVLTDETSGFTFFYPITSSIGAANSGVQYANATVANRGQFKAHSYFAGTSVAGFSTLTSQSGVVGTNSSISINQDYSKWTAQAAATTPGSAPISGTWAFKSAGTINSTTVPSLYHIQLTNLAGTLADRLSLSSEGLLQLPGYSTGVAQFDSSGNVSSSSLNLASSLTTVQTSKLFYVDGNRSDTYTADGTVSKPFKTIGAATSQIITNNDGANYVIYIYPGTYSENISLNNAAFTRLAIIGSQENSGSLSAFNIPIVSLVGNITSTSSNTNLKALVVHGIDMQGNIVLNGDIDTTNFCTFGCVFDHMVVSTQSAVGIDLLDVGQVIFDDVGVVAGAGAGAINVNNVENLLTYSTFFNMGTLTTTTNGGGNKPSGFSATNVQLSYGSYLGSIVHGASCTMANRFERITGTISNSGTETSINSVFTNTVTINSGGVMNSEADTFTSMPVNSGTFNPTGLNYYTPTTSSNWNSVPATVRAGLDNLAGSGIVKSQTQNFVMASPNGSSGVMSARALVAADIPSLSATYLPLAGGTMSGAINLGTFVANNSGFAASSTNLLRYDQTVHRPDNTSDFDAASVGIMNLDHLTSVTTNPATVGFLRLAKTDALDWRNNANSANIALGHDTSDNLTYNGTAFLSSSPTLLAAAFPALTGDITTSAGSLATTIAANAVTNSKIADTTIDLTAKVTGILPVANGGTGASSLTVHGVVIGNSTSAVNVTSAGSSGQVLTSNGAGADPTFQAVSSTTVANSYSVVANAGLANSVGSNALTINLVTSSGATPSGGSSVVIPYRNSTNATGQFTQDTTNAALSIVVPSGATLGQISAKAEYIYVYGQDNSGTSQLCVSTAGTFDQGINQTSTAITSGSTSRTVLYCTAAVTGPIHLIGRLLSTQTTAGTWAATASNISLAPFLPETPYQVAYVSDQKTSGTDGGTFTSGAWQTRTLNTTSGDTAFVSIASNQFTLQPGTYYIHAVAPGYQVGRHQAKLRNITASSDDLIGTSMVSNSVTASTTQSVIDGKITLSVVTTYEIQHQCNNTEATNGFGLSAGFSVSEIYTMVAITKINAEAGAGF